MSTMNMNDYLIGSLTKINPPRVIRYHKNEIVNPAADRKPVFMASTDDTNFHPYVKKIMHEVPGAIIGGGSALATMFGAPSNDNDIYVASDVAASLPPTFWNSMEGARFWSSENSWYGIRIIRIYPPEAKFREGQKPITELSTFISTAIATDAASTVGFCDMKPLAIETYATRGKWTEHPEVDIPAGTGKRYMRFEQFPGLTGYPKLTYFVGHRNSIIEMDGNAAPRYAETVYSGAELEQKKESNHIIDLMIVDKRYASPERFILQEYDIAACMTYIAKRRPDSSQFGIYSFYPEDVNKKIARFAFHPTMTANLMKSSKMYSRLLKYQEKGYTISPGSDMKINNIHARRIFHWLSMRIAKMAARATEVYTKIGYSPMDFARDLASPKIFWVRSVSKMHNFDQGTYTSDPCVVSAEGGYHLMFEPVMLADMSKIVPAGADGKVDDRAPKCVHGGYADFLINRHYADDIKYGYMITFGYITMKVYLKREFAADWFTMNNFVDLRGLFTCTMKSLTGNKRNIYHYTIQFAHPELIDHIDYNYGSSVTLSRDYRMISFDILPYIDEAPAPKPKVSHILPYKSTVLGYNAIKTSNKHIEVGNYVDGFKHNKAYYRDFIMREISELIPTSYPSLIERDPLAYHLAMQYAAVIMDLPNPEQYFMSVMHKGAELLEKPYDVTNLDQAPTTGPVPPSALASGSKDSSNMKVKFQGESEREETSDDECEE